MNFKSLAALIVLIAAIGALAFYTYWMVVEKDAITLGLDLEGGVYVLLEAQSSPEQPVTDDAIERAKAVIQNRVDELGTREPEITREGANRIRVAIPGAENQEQVLSLIGKTALLEFKQLKVEGEEVKTEAFLTGKHLKDARVAINEKGQPYVAVELTKEGGNIMREFTRNNIGQYLVITLDDEVISMPVVEDEIGEQGSIQGNFTVESAKQLALLLRSGALPVPLKVMETRAIGPKLGLDSLKVSVRAGLIGIALILLFMLVYYRAFGIFADIALIAYAAIVLAVLAGLNATLTLPGVVGLILGVGMAVDANIIIFERVKEEIRSGRTVRSAIDVGFTRALRTILDANITTLIAAAVLFRFGTGPIKGFAVTLAISILASMFTAVLVTKWLLRLAVRSGLVKSNRAIGRV